MISRPFHYCGGYNERSIPSVTVSLRTPPLDTGNKLSSQSPSSSRSLLALGLLAPVVGATAGFLGVGFRLALEHADLLRNALITKAHNHKPIGALLVTIFCAGATAASAWLVRQFSPNATGSGIPYVETIISDELEHTRSRLIPVKFVGGLLSIGSGLALGREGPIVQMGSNCAHLVGKLFKRDWPDCRVLIAAGAGAGLATAFNAPIAGAVFVLEELVQKFEPRIAIAALGASTTAIVVARLFLGDKPDFTIPVLHYASAETRPLFFVLGIVAGLIGIAYNYTLVRTITIAQGLVRWPVELRAGLVGGAVGILAWFAPGLVGGGDPITQRTLLGAGTLTLLPFIFLVRFGLGAVSYAAETPGGLFAPVLVLGAQVGLYFGLLCRLAFPSLNIEPVAFAVVGMAAFFTGVVRAPLTGMLLVCEMTGSVTMILPMLSACFLAMLVPRLLGNAPIYDSLRELTLRRNSDRQIGSEETMVPPE
jgi:chloride channel protein, CIC family